MPLSDRLRLFAPRVGGLLLAAALAGSCQRGDSGVVRIGVAGSFSDPIGLPMKEAAELAAERKGLFGGRAVAEVEAEILTRQSAANTALQGARDAAANVRGAADDCRVSHLTRPCRRCP